MINETSLGPNGQSVPALVKDTGKQTFNVEFCPKFVGEHKIGVNYKKVPLAGSPFSCKVYDVNSIKVTPVKNGVIGQPVTFVSEYNETRTFGYFHYVRIRVEFNFEQFFVSYS